ncbi:hypothetical protein [Sinobaca sp. H24]|uniref:hypothetical protein n=1 Tax=Sinobaca sp. H24 TaxID=2923376 RepID=UPI00207A055F|nr:hypothetical protein [Sinobaca sp. H24]
MFNAWDWLFFGVAAYILITMDYSNLTSFNIMMLTLIAISLTLTISTKWALWKNERKEGASK